MFLISVFCRMRGRVNPKREVKTDKKMSLQLVGA